MKAFTIAKNLTRNEVMDLAKKNGLKFMLDIDYIFVYEFNSKIGFRASEVTIPTSYNAWYYQNYGKVVSFDVIKSDKILNFLEDLKKI